MVDHLNTNFVVGGGFLKKESEISIYGGKTLLNKKYHGLGISQLGPKCVFSFFSHPNQQNILRFDYDVRAGNENSQKLADKVRCIPYGFIPNYNNYADKRDFDISKKIPFNKGKIEPVIIYVSPIRNFWKKRSRNIFLAKSDVILAFYNELKNHTNRLERDSITIIEKSEMNPSQFKIKRDYYLCWRGRNYQLFLLVFLH